MLNSSAFLEQHILIVRYVAGSENARGAGLEEFVHQNAVGHFDAAVGHQFCCGQHSDTSHNHFSGKGLPISEDYRAHCQSPRSSLTVASVTNRTPRAV